MTKLSASLIMRTLALVALLSVRSEVAFAQVTTTNLGAGGRGNESVRANNWLGQAFTTDGLSYTLDSVTLQFGTATATGGQFFAAVFSANGNNPGTLLETLTGSTSPSGAASYTFTSTGLSLSANTTYHLVTGVTGGLGDFSWQSVSLATGVTGPWTFPNYFTASTNQGGGWSQTGAKMVMSVTATAVPEPGITSLLAGLCGLSAVAWRRAIRSSRDSFPASG